MVPAPRLPDKRLDEWWVENPWMIATRGFNLSSYERNRTYLNVGGTAFHDISTLSATDSKGDGRSVIAVDVTQDGMQDLLVRQMGGGALLVFENRFPEAGWLTVTLRGDTSNTAGIGARVIAEVASRTLRREVYPHNGNNAQGPTDLHLGLGDARKLARLTVHWPSGASQTFEDVQGNRHIEIREGDPTLRDAAGR